MNFQFFGAVAFFLVRPKEGESGKIPQHTDGHCRKPRPLALAMPASFGCAFSREISETGGSASILIQLERMHRKLEKRRSGNAGVSLKQT